MENTSRNYFTNVLNQINNIMNPSTKTNDKMYVEEITDLNDMDLSRNEGIEMLQDLADEMEAREKPYCLCCGVPFETSDTMLLDDGVERAFREEYEEDIDVHIPNFNMEDYCRSCCDDKRKEARKERLAYWRNPDPEDKYDI